MSNVLKRALVFLIYSPAYHLHCEPLTPLHRLPLEDLPADGQFLLGDLPVDESLHKLLVDVGPRRSQSNHHGLNLSRLDGIKAELTSRKIFRELVCVLEARDLRLESRNCLLSFNVLIASWSFQQTRFSEVGENKENLERKEGGQNTNLKILNNLTEISSTQRRTYLEKIHSSKSST